MGNVVFHWYLYGKHDYFNWCLQQIKFPLINNLIAHSKPVIMALYINGKNQFPYKENKWDFYFHSMSLT